MHDTVLGRDGGKRRYLREGESPRVVVQGDITHRQAKEDNDSGSLTFM